MNYFTSHGMNNVKINSSL